MEQEVKKASPAAALVLSFVVGGLFSVVGQLFMNLANMLFGIGSAMVSPFVLVCMGLLGVILFVPGWYQKIMDFGGFGAIMPFCGFACACAGEYLAEKEKGSSTWKAIGAAYKLLAYVVGTAAIFFVCVALIYVFGIMAAG